MALQEDSPRDVAPGRAITVDGWGSVLVGLLLSLRPKQWTKNGLLFIGLIFSLNLGRWELVLLSTAGFTVFCALCGGVYLLNDVVDVEKDRSHPRKRHRPIASGRVPARVATLAALILLGLALPAGFAINFFFGLLALSYVVLTSAYTLWLKHVVIVDVFAIAAGFVLRAVAGAVAISVPISPWLYVCTILGALFLALGKRRHELLLLNDGANNHRPILQEYTTKLLDQMIAVVTPALVMAYSLYTFSQAPNLPQNHAMMLTIPFVLYGVFRYMYLIHVRNEGGSPEEVLLRDRPLLADAVLWLLSSVFILYLF